MSVISYPEIISGLVVFSILVLRHWIRNRNAPIIDLPVLRMLPGLLWNMPHIHDYATRILKLSGGTMEFKGPWFSNMGFVLTSDPMNTHHILSKNFSNYPKGPDFGTIFDPLGDGILAADSDSWKLQRKMTHSYFAHAEFQVFLERCVREKVVEGLIPVLDHACELGMEVDMQDVFQRLNFDCICSVVLGFDPKCLSLELPEVPYEKAFGDIELGVLYRHVLPEKYWKLLRWLQIGQEKKLTTALKIFDDFIYQCIASKRRNRTKAEINYDFLTAYLAQEQEQEQEQGQGQGQGQGSDKRLRDAATNLVVAGRDTTSAALSWFFWLIVKNQSVKNKILEEINEHLVKEDGKKVGLFGADELNKLVYLHAALCEALRLYPSLPINRKASVEADTLPSGHRVKKNTTMLISFYAMGRMESIWGKDCLEFKPERWISERGGIVHRPSYMFTAFNAGPRSCLGKDMSFVQMKIVAVAIVLNYELRVVEGHLVSPSTSVVLHMKQGMKVRVVKKKNLVKSESMS